MITIEKVKREELKEAISIYDENHNVITNREKLFKQYEKLENNPDYYNLVAKLDGKIVGMATVIVNHDIVEELKPFLTVWNLGVHKDYRRKKVGTALLDYIYELGKTLNCDFISLIAETENEIGQKFYDSLGYQREVGYVRLIGKQKW